MDSAGRRLAKARLPEGVAGIARLHTMIGAQLGDDADEDDAGQVAIGIETDRGPWVAALIAAGYTVFAINPLQASRYRERHGVSGAKSDTADAHVLADMVRTDSHQLRPVAGDSAQAAAIKVVARTHKTLIWERARHSYRLRHALRDYFPAALEAFEDLDAADTLELLARAPEPASAAKLTTAQISAALKRARRRGIAAKAERIQAVLRTAHLGQPDVVAAACAASAPAAPGTTPPCASSPTGSSASCTAASKPAPSTTRRPPGRSTQRPRRRLRLDNLSSWDVCLVRNPAAHRHPGRKRPPSHLTD